MAKICPRSCWMTFKLFFTQIEFLVLMHYDLLVFHKYSDWIAQVHSTKSWLFLTKNLTIFWITESRNTINIAVMSQNNPIERIFVSDHPFMFTYVLLRHYSLCKSLTQAMLLTQQILMTIEYWWLFNGMAVCIGVCKHLLSVN